MWFWSCLPGEPFYGEMFTLEDLATSQEAA